MAVKLNFDESCFIASNCCSWYCTAAGVNSSKDKLLARLSNPESVLLLKPSLESSADSTLVGGGGTAGVVGFSKLNSSNCFLNDLVEVSDLPFTVNDRLAALEEGAGNCALDEVLKDALRPVSNSFFFLSLLLDPLTLFLILCLNFLSIYINY